MTGRAKNFPDPTSCHDGHYDLSVTYRPVGDFITDSAFLCAFSHDPTTFATDPRVVRSVTGSAPVEHLHKQFRQFTKCLVRGHGGRVVTLSSPTSAAGV